MIDAQGQTGEVRKMALEHFDEWHEDQFECHFSAISESDQPRYHASFLKQAFLDAFALGVEIGANE